MEKLNDTMTELTNENARLNDEMQRLLTPQKSSRTNDTSPDTSTGSSHLLVIEFEQLNLPCNIRVDLYSHSKMRSKHSKVR